MTTPIEPNPSRWGPSSDPTSIVVPGLDTNAPINDQIDQIEQLITIKLQNIDANFSKIQHLMATRLLPAVKRYALGTEPVREAAKFWTSFYEQAAQVHIPTLEDDGDEFVHDAQTQPSVAAPDSTTEFVSGPLDASSAPSQVAPAAYDVTTSESSFMPSNAVSSTPARPGRERDHTIDEPSWSASIELPMTRLKNELQNFAREEEEETSLQQDASALTDSIMYEEEDTVQQVQTIDQGKKGKEKSVARMDPDESVEPLQVPPSALPTPRANTTSTRVPPLKVKPKTPITIPKHVQSFLPSRLENEPVFSSPRRPRYERSPKKTTVVSPSASTSTSASVSSSVLDIPSLTKQASDSNPEPKFSDFNDSFDDSIDLMQGMSPPRTLAFARAPRSSVGLGLLQPFGRTPGKDLLPTLGRTPRKEAADRIRRDLLGDMQSQLGINSAASNKMRTPAFGYASGVVKDDTMSTIPTPPSLSRYMRHAPPSWTDNNDNDTDTSLATMMRRLGLEIPDSSLKSDSVSSASRSRASSRTDVLESPDQRELDVFDSHHDDQSAIQMGSHRHADANADSDSDSDSLIDEPVHSSHPSTAFIMASSREPGPDDSFGSSNSNHSIDSLVGDEFEGEEGAAVHPFARALEAREGEGDGFDDSFDSEGGYEAGQGDDCSVATEETVFGIPPARRGQQGSEPGQLRLLGEDLLQDTIGIGGQLAKVGRIEESPTPYGRDR